MLRSLQSLEGFSMGATDGPIGKVKDFYFDDQAWVIRYAIVNAKSWLGRDVLISPHSLGEAEGAPSTKNLEAPGQSMQSESLPPRARTLIRLVSTAVLLALAACSQLSNAKKPAPNNSSPRAQLSIGYSLLYQEADGIPKLRWILMFKDKPEEMGRVTNDLVSYYQQLADTLRRLSMQYPAMRIDVPTMSEIEGDERKAIGEDLAKDFVPLVGKSGVRFEREALLMFYNSLNEQRHLTGVMIGLETDPGLRKFLETTKAQLEERYSKVGALLDRRYFTQ